MNDNGFTAAPNAMSTGGQQFLASADKVKATHVKLLAALDAEGQCWGKDEVGAGFAKQYVQNALKAIDAFAQVDGGVQSVAGATEAWADGYRQVDGI